MNREDRLHALVREIDTNVMRVEEAVRLARQEQQRIPIPGALGTVVVDGAGVLVSVELDPRALRTTNGQTLGAQVCRAIAQAEAAAAQAYENRIATAKHHITL
jgi:DNA-binding protein YbaB